MDLYHTLNRGVDKRTIFEDSQDYARFVHDMFEFNSTERSRNSYRSMCDVGRRTLKEREVEKIVDIHGWCLMHNHYHLLLSEKVEGGIPLFLKKLNGGYAKYFNERYERTGALFQGKTKKILIDSDAYFLHILNYIHFNPLDMHADSGDWREKRITNADGALAYLTQYKWSSYNDYVGRKNFPSILTTSLFNDVFNHRYAESVEKYLNDIHTTNVQSLSLE